MNQTPNTIFMKAEEGESINPHIDPRISKAVPPGCDDEGHEDGGGFDKSLYMKKFSYDVFDDRHGAEQPGSKDHTIKPHPKIARNGYWT